MYTFACVTVGGSVASHRVNVRLEGLVAGRGRGLVPMGNFRSNIFELHLLLQVARLNVVLILFTLLQCVHVNRWLVKK